VVGEVRRVALASESRLKGAVVVWGSQHNPAEPMRPEPMRPEPMRPEPMHPKARGQSPFRTESGTVAAPPFSTPPWPQSQLKVEAEGLLGVSFVPSRSADNPGPELPLAVLPACRNHWIAMVTA
jgi:hypothetical protein